MTTLQLLHLPFPLPLQIYAQQIVQTAPLPPPPPSLIHPILLQLFIMQISTQCHVSFCVAKHDGMKELEAGRYTNALQSTSLAR